MSDDLAKMISGEDTEIHVPEMRLTRAIGLSETRNGDFFLFEPGVNRDNSGDEVFELESDDGGGVSMSIPTGSVSIVKASLRPSRTAAAAKTAGGFLDR